jgi:CRP/FNR family cyclic AMP-dependent transcriptional regulator
MRLLELDPDLGAGLEPDAFASARQLAIAPVLRLERGTWDPATAALHPALRGEPLCLLVGRGLLMCSTAIGNRSASVIVGPGEIVPMPSAGDSELSSRCVVVVAEPAIVAVLDARFMSLARRWPGLGAEILRRISDQLRRASLAQAISHLSRTEDRVLAFAWHLSERFGRVGPGGVTVSVRLTHETIGRLIGAERSTVTLAIAALEREGLLRRRADGLIELPHGSARRLCAPEDDGIKLPKSCRRAPELSMQAQEPGAAHGRGPAQPPSAAEQAPIDMEAMLARAARARELAASTVLRSRRLCDRSARVRSRTDEAMASVTKTL